jgi:conjugative relaxase-like TrwC/TraI family protein
LSIKNNQHTFAAVTDFRGETTPMLSISPLSGGDHRYYLSLTNVNYYTESGEPLGTWHGLAASEFGLKGYVEKEHLERLCNGFHHETGEKLVQNAGVTEGDKARKPGDDMTFSADKTISALFAATTDEELRAGIRAAHERAVKVALDLAQAKAGFVRIGKDGQESIPAPLVWALFEHCTSRAQDPQLHTHALLLNLTVLENGKTRTIDSTHIYHWKMALGALYRAEMARGMQRLGFDVERVDTGSSVFFRIRGVPEELVEFWSKRRAELEEKLRLELGSLDAASAKAKEIATLETRRKKEEERARKEMHETWEQEAREYGFTPEYIQSLRRPYQAPKPDETEQNKAEIWREALSKLSYHNAYWSEAEMTKTVAERAAGRLSAMEVRELIANKIRSPELVTKGHLITREKNASENQYLDRVEEQFSTPRILATEKKYLDLVQGLHERAGRHEVKREILDEVFRKYPTIDPEQKRAVEYLTSGGPIRLLSGTAGAGKSFCLKVCNEVWTRENRTVVGVAEQGSTQKMLEQETGIKSDTLAMTLIRLDSGRLKLTERTTVVCDEAGMLGTVPMARLQSHVAKAQARLVFAGDSLQLQPVQAGAPFKYIADIVGEEKLVNIRRQKEQWARDAVHDLKAGRSDEALRKFLVHDQLIGTDTRREAMQKQIAKWKELGGVTNPERVLMVADLNHEVRELSLQAQAERIRAGLVDPARKIYANKVFFHVGDKLVFKQPSRFYDIVNGDRALVLDVDPQRNRLTVKLDRDGREVEINLNPKARRYSADKLCLAYCVTTYGAQGVTVPHCLVLLGGPMANLHSGYVQGSRGQESTWFFINKQEAGPELRDIVRSLAKVRQKKMAHEVFYPEKKPRLRKDKSEGKDLQPETVKPPDLTQSSFNGQHRPEEPRRRQGRPISF